MKTQKSNPNIPKPQKEIKTNDHSISPPPKRPIPTPPPKPRDKSTDK